jgi:uncharacterized protein
MLITDLGFSKGIIFETIVSTFNESGTPNAAPMGVITEDDQTLSLNMFNSSQTIHNIKASGCAVINLTSDITIFYRSTFKEVNPDGKLPLEWFEKAESVNAPKLRWADATLDVSVTHIQLVGRDKSKLQCEVEKVTATKQYPQPICRAMALTLEAIIHASRIKAFAVDSSKQEEVHKLLGLIENCSEVVNRVAPKSTYTVVMADLTNRINHWRTKQ